MGLLAMMRGRGLSIGQRLGVGFALVLLTFFSALTLFFNWHAASARAEARYAEQIAPLATAIAALERATYSAAISVRSLLLRPSTERAQLFRENVAIARARLADLGAVVSSSEDRSHFARVDSGLNVYLETGEELAARRLLGAVAQQEEANLTNLRLSLLMDSGRFGEAVEARAKQALDEITAIRVRISRGLLVMGVAFSGLLALLAWATAGSVSRPAKSLARTAAALQAGDWKPALALAARLPAEANPRDEMQRLAQAMGAAALALEAREKRLRADGAVSKSVSATLDRSRLANDVLREVIAHADAEVGVVYAFDTTAGELAPIASYGLGAELQSLKLGEGAPGQAAQMRQPLHLRELPPDSGFRVKLGYDEAPPRAVSAVPLVFADVLHGVLTVASVRDFGDNARAFIEASAAQLGVGLQNASAYERIQMLLQRMRESAEQIQAQNEELQAQNEEIQAQSQQLQAQQEEIQAQNEELQQQSDELRAHALELAEADDRKTRFLGVLAHELRNPMASIANSIFIIRNAPPGSAGARRAQDIIERQSAHLVRLIDDLLDVTRISEGKIHIARERLDLGEVVRTCAEDCAAAYEKAEIDLQVDAPDTPVEVDGDRTRLCQVLGNLLNNSLKFTNRGGRVQISLRVDRAASSAILRVIDDGVGMEPELLTRLFQPFSQGVNGLARTHGGLGLGLALVKTLVNMHDGEVYARSAGPGLGAEFVIRLPLHSAESARAQRPHLERAPASVQAAGRRVLIIEDNVDVAASLRDALALQGYEVAVAHSGPEGIERAGALQPHVIFCDIGLPGQDGYDIARRLRSDPRTQRAVLIALTGYASGADKQHARAAGFDLHLAKPLTLASVPSLIGSLDTLGGATSSEAARSG